IVTHSFAPAHESRCVSNRHPEAISGIIVQIGSACVEGARAAFEPLKPFWANAPGELAAMFSAPLYYTQPPLAVGGYLFSRRGAHQSIPLRSVHRVNRRRSPLGRNMRNRHAFVIED